MTILGLAARIVRYLEINRQGKANLLEGTCSLDKTLNANARLSAAKVVEKFEYVDGKCKFGVDWSPSNETVVHKCNVGILVLVLLHDYSGQPTS